MRQLSGLDAAFLALDTATTSGHIGGICILGPPAAGEPALTLERLRELVGSRLHLVPIMRQRILEVPLGLDQPYWTEDRDFDLRYHVRESSLQAPGTICQLTKEVSRLHAPALDRRHPLWEIHLLRGFNKDQMALYGKFHHSMMDGVAGQRIMTALLDPSPESRADLAAPPWEPVEAQPGAFKLVAHSLLALAAKPRQGMKLCFDVIRSFPHGLAALPPRTPFNAFVTRNRRIALRTVPLDAVRAVSTASEVTVNDVVVAMCAGGLRKWLEVHDALPERPLVAALPVSDRTAGGDQTPGNRMSLMLASLPTHLPDPLMRLEATGTATRRAKRHQARSKSVFADASSLAMPALLEFAAKLNAWLGLSVRFSPFNLFISNVPGPTAPLYISSQPLLSMYPISAIMEGQGLNITVLSYRDALHFGFVCDPKLVFDLEVMADHVTQELGVLVARVTGGDGRHRDPPVRVAGTIHEVEGCA